MRPQTRSVAYSLKNLLAVIIGSFLLTAAAQAQTLTVLQSFTNSTLNSPIAGPTLDRSGNLYGTTLAGGPAENGGVYKLSHVGSSWELNDLYSFSGGNDGREADYGSLIIGADGTLFGTTRYGGGTDAGTVLNLRPPATITCRTVSCPWSEVVLHRFGGSNDGSFPDGRIAFDSTGNLYGTTYSGGAYGNGTVFELTRSGGGWIEAILYSFAGGNDGANPASGITIDNAGNLYGTTSSPGNGYGTVFELTRSGSGWTKTILHQFNGDDGNEPHGGVVLDGAGNLFGGTIFGGADNAGVVYELSPSGQGWTYSMLHTFDCVSQELCGETFRGVYNTLTIDASGDIYGTTYADTYGFGSVFKLTPSNGGWIFTDLHDFTGGNDGSGPAGALALDPSGNIYGTTLGGGAGDYGVVFEITP